MCLLCNTLMVGKTASVQFCPPPTHVDYLGTVPETMIPVDKDQMAEMWHDPKVKRQYVTALAYQNFQVTLKGMGK
jgi:hypothetical protein